MIQRLNLIRLQNKPNITLSDVSIEMIDFSTFIYICIESNLPEHITVNLLSRMNNITHDYYNIISPTITFNKPLIFEYLLKHMPQSWDAVVKVLKCIMIYKHLIMFQLFMDKYYIKPNIYRSSVITEINKHITLGYYDLNVKQLMDSYPEDFPYNQWSWSDSDIQILLGHNDNIPSPAMNDIFAVLFNKDISTFHGMNHIINVIDKWDINQTNLLKLCCANITIQQFKTICDKRNIQSLAKGLCHEYLNSSRIEFIELIISKQLCDVKFIQYLVFTRLNHVSPIKSTVSADYICKITTDQDILDLNITPESCWCYHPTLIKRVCEVRPQLWNELAVDESNLSFICIHCPEYNIINKYVQPFEHVYEQRYGVRIYELLLEVYHILHIRFKNQHKYIFEFKPTVNSLFGCYVMMSDMEQIKLYVKQNKVKRLVR